MSPIAYLTWILALGIAAQWLAWKLKLPSILLLLGIGFAFGQFSGIRIDDFLAEGNGGGSPLLSLVGLFVAIILFEGGLTLKFRELRDSGLPILRLCTVAVAISAAFTTLFLMGPLGYDWRIAALVGCILSVTGPTVIAPLLRHVNPNRKMGAIVKWEGIVVDPIGAILAVLVFKMAMAPDFIVGRSETFEALGMMIVVGVIGALVVAKIVEFLLARHLVPDFLQPVFLLAVVAVTFTVSNLMEKEAGLLSVTVLGMALANQKKAPVRHILEFKENLRTLIISSLFITLAGRVTFYELAGAFENGIWLLIALLLVGRPLSVYLSLAGSKQTSLKERTFLAFLAPRGIVAAAVTSIFALEFEEAGKRGHFGPEQSAEIIEQSRELVPLVFLVIIGTVSVYGLAAAPLARHLQLASKDSNGILFAGASEWARLAAKALHDDKFRVLLLDTNYANVSAAKMLGLDAHRANVLSEFAEEELDLGGLGHIVAGTPNDEVNSIAASRFQHQFGRVGSWQLAAGDKDDHHRKSVSGEIRSRICFAGGPTHKELTELVRAGGVMKKTTITEVFSYDQFLAAFPGAIVMFLVDSKGTRPAPADLDAISAETTIFSLVPNPQLAEKKAKRKHEDRDRENNSSA